MFVFDDEPAIVENPHIRSLWPLTAAMTAPSGTTLSGRPAAALTFAVSYALAPAEARDVFRLPPSASTVQLERFLQNVWSYHAANFLIHLSASLALFGVVRRTLHMFPRGRGVRERASALALSCALLWAVHPLTTSAVTYLVQRVESMMALCVLLTLYCSIRAWSGSRWWTVAAVSACAAGMASKESMVAAPLLVVIWDLVFSAVQPWRELLWRRRVLYAGLAATWIFLAVLVAGGHRPDAAGFGFAEWPWWRYLMTQSGVIVHYLRLVLWPSPLVLDYDWRPSTVVSSLLPASFIGLLLFAGAIAFYRRRPLGFAIVAFFLLLAPTSSVLPVVTEVAAEHRMYLPLALVIAVLVIAAFTYVQNRRVLPAVGAVAVVLVAAGFGTVTSARNRDYHSAEGLWRDTVNKRPENARARHNYATILLADGRVGEAEQQLREAIRLRPDHAEAHAALGAALCAQQRFTEGLEHLNTALTIAPDFAGAHQSLGEAYASQGQMSPAIAAYERALALRPDDVMVMNRIGWILATDAEDSIRNGARALELGLRATALTRELDATSLDTLAAAQAEMGQWQNASKSAAQAILRARANGESEYVPELEARLRLYRASQSFRSNVRQK